MHFDFHFTAVQILWTLTFAALLVLLIVLLGRDRMRRFPWFTTGIVLIALRLLVDRILRGKLPPLTMAAVSLTLADLSALVGLVILVEIARKVFRRVSARAWTVWGILLLAIGGVVLWKWGPWPNWKTLSFDTAIARLQFMQFLAVKTGLLTNVLAVLLGVLVVAFGARYGAGWRSHAQRIMIGLSTAALAQLALQGVWESIVRHTLPHSRAEYEHVMNLQEKLLNSNSLVYLLVVVWWIVCLWVDEPGTAAPTGAVAASTDSAPAEEVGEA